MIISTEAIVLKSYDVRETSRLAVFFTREAGKVTGILKGIRKDPKKFGSNIDKFSVNDMVYYRYSKSDVHLISQCDLKEFFLPLRQDYRRNIAASYILELVDAIMPAEQPNKRVYHLMHDYLNSLQRVKDIDKLVYIFQVKMLLFSGFRPHLDSCVRCGRKVAGKARFSLQSGGLICALCPTTETSFSMISPGTIAYILHIEQSVWNKATMIELTKTAKKELKYILNNFLVYHLEKRLKTADLLKLK